MIRKLYLVLFLLYAASLRAADLYVATNGSDTADGSAAHPLLTVQKGLDALGTPGDTLYLRGGTYFQAHINVASHGSAAQWLTLRNYPGEKPIIDGGYREFRGKGNSDWEVHDAAKGVYRSVGKYPSARYVFGYFGPEYENYRLVTYLDYGTLSTDNEDYTDRSPYFYMGPGVFWNHDDQRIYVRLKRSRYELLLGYSIPADTDPRQTPLYLFPDGAVMNFSRQAAYLSIKGVDFRFQNYALHFASGAHHVAVRQAVLQGGRYHIAIRDGVSDLLFDRITFADGIPPWVPRNDAKRPKDGRPAQFFQGAGIDMEGKVTNVEVRNSIFFRLFDGIDTHAPEHLRICHNEFRWIHDDVLEIGSAGCDVEVAYNRMAPVSSAISWTGTGGPPAGKAGTKYIHHNIIDTAVPMLYGRHDPRQLLQGRYVGPKGDGFATGRAFNMHSSDAVTAPDPWKIYHNTIRGGSDIDHRGLGVAYFLKPFDRSHPHEVYNNIFVQTADHEILNSARAADGSQIFDGNLYFRPMRGPRTPLFRDIISAGGSFSFANLAEFKSSSIWAATKANYPPGWETSGTEADPQLDQEFVPASGGPAVAGAVDLSRKGWPGADASRWRGAIPPAGHGVDGPRPGISHAE